MQSNKEVESLGMKFARLQRATVILELGCALGKSYVVNEAGKVILGLTEEIIRLSSDLINIGEKNGKEEESHQAASAGRDEATKQQSGHKTKSKGRKS